MASLGSASLLKWYNALVWAYFFLAQLFSTNAGQAMRTSTLYESNYTQSTTHGIWVVQCIRGQGFGINDEAPMVIGRNLVQRW